MSKKTSYVLGILLTIIIGTILYWLFCCKPCIEAKNAAKEAARLEAATPKEKVVTKNAFSAIDLSSGLKFSSNDNFNFNSSSFSIIEPISENLNGELVKLSGYLKDNPNKVIDVTGYYTALENNTSAFPSLGLARANAVKNYLVSQGISSKSINTVDKLEDSLVPDQSNIYYGPLAYTIGNKGANNAAELSALRNDIRANPLTLYFKTGSASINLTPGQRVKVSKMVRYVDKVDNALIKTIGHTDNTGSRTANIQLGKGRAEFAKNYLVRNGISSSKINASSQGPDAPIADNNTVDGRAKNRRVVVTIN